MKKILLIGFGIISLAVVGYFIFIYEHFANDVFYESSQSSIESSTYHENGTWWGYNESKLTRIDDVVFTYYIDNKDQLNGVANIDNPNLAVLLMIKEDGSIIIFDKVDTSRPVNILSDPTRKLVYAIVVEPTMSNDNGSTGKLVVYRYQYDGTLGVTFIDKTVVVDHSGSGLETVNIRVGATIDTSGNIGVAYGLADASYTFSMVVQLYDVENNTWYEKSVYMNGVQEPNFYPDIAMNNLNDFVIVAVQDNCLGGACKYMYLRYFVFKDDVWEYDILDDYREYINEVDEYTIVEHTEVYLDHHGVYHLVWRSTLEDTVFHHATLDENGNIVKREIAVNKDINWLRIVEVDNVLYFIGHGNGRTEIIDFNTFEVLHNDASTPIENGYFYAYSDNTQIDCLILNGDYGTYGNQKDEYHSYMLIEPNS